MNEIEEMYQNAGIEKQYITLEDDYGKYQTHEKLYPQFTAEKQLELIKWLSQRRLLNITFCEDKNTYQFFNEKCTGAFCEDLATSIATLVQCELDSCTEQEKEQVRDILK